MPVYFSFLLFLSLFAVIDFYRRRRQCIRYGLVFCGIFLILIAGLRFYCGPDYKSYYTIFKNIVNNRNTWTLEFGFLRVNELFGAIANFRIMLLCIAAVSITLKLIFFKRESDAPFLSILLYFIGTFLAQDFGQIRQGLAISFALFAFNEAYKRRFVPFVLLFTLAFSFHYTAIIILPFYWMGRVKLSILLTALLMLASVIFARYFLDLMDVLVPGLNISYLTEQFSAYRDRRFGFELQNFVSTLITHIPVILFYYIFEKKLLGDTKSRYYFQLFIWGTCMTIAFMPIPEVALRGPAYFEILDVILLPNIIKILKPDGRFIFCVFIVLLVLAKFLLNNIEMPDSFIPYQINFNLLEN
jgi:hypothetical protein